MNNKRFKENGDLNFSEIKNLPKNKISEQEAKFQSYRGLLERDRKIKTENDFLLVGIPEKYWERLRKECVWLNEEKIFDEGNIRPFYSDEILSKIKNELSKTHLEDDNLKITAFFVGLTGFLREHKKRMSMAFTGDSSTGKDNIMKTILKHMPGDCLFLTGATQPAIEDEARFTKILALSEVNLFQENGANKNLLEVVKQRTEGGTSSLKKDVMTGFRTTKHEQTEQGTIFYGTTDAERNSETETRFIFGHVEADEKKIKIVNFNTAEMYSNLEKLISQEKETPSWIKKGLSCLLEKYGNCFILIPFAKFLIEREVIDNRNPRSMRDFKRLLALVSARTFLSAPVRECVDYGGERVLVSIPQDFMDVVRFSSEFFNQTYAGMDERLNRVLEIIDSSLCSWVSRDSIQRLTKTSVNTIRSWMNTLQEMGCVEWKKGADLNFQENTKVYDGNKIYFKRCKKGMKTPLIRYEENQLKEIFKDYKLIPFTQERCQNKGVNLEKNELDTPKIPQIDTFSLIPFENSPTIKEIESLKDEEIQDLSEENE